MLTERELVQPVWKTVWRFLTKVKTELPHDPAISRLGTYPNKTKTLSQKLRECSSLQHYLQSSDNIETTKYPPTDE